MAGFSGTGYLFQLQCANVYLVHKVFQNTYYYYTLCTVCTYICNIHAVYAHTCILHYTIQEDSIKFLHN